jgi:metallo-beta-lactamase family protein
MFQGCNLCDTKNFLNFLFDASTVDAVLITHAHLDHTGRLPKLIKEGFKGKIYCTPPTAKLAQLVLDDAFQIMKEDNKREYRPMLYGLEDIEEVRKRYVTVDYSRKVTVGDFTFRFRDAGHIFGSSFIEVEEKGGARASFSGDIGNVNMPILKPTAQLAETDCLVVESTYGNRVHEDESTRESKLREVVERTIKKKGVLIIPAFAIERTQQLLYELNHLVENKLIPPIEMYLDSPMAIKATEIIKSYPQYYQEEALKLVARGDDMFDFPGLHITPTKDQSKTINDAPRPKIIISGSGMMNGGRILHHLVRYLSDPNSTVLIIGYQAEGTLGRDLYSGKKSVQVLQEHVQVKAIIDSIGAYSAHGDQNKLVNWISEAARRPKKENVQNTNRN